MWWDGSFCLWHRHAPPCCEPSAQIFTLSSLVQLCSWDCQFIGEHHCCPPVNQLSVSPYICIWNSDVLLSWNVDPRATGCTHATIVIQLAPNHDNQNCIHCHSTTAPNYDNLKHGSSRLWMTLMPCVIAFDMLLLALIGCIEDLLIIFFSLTLEHAQQILLSQRNTLQMVQLNCPRCNSSYK